MTETKPHRRLFPDVIRRICPVVLLLAWGCLEPYQPELDKGVVDILVVDAFMNATEGTASARLSHSLAVYDPNRPTPEFGAKVSIESSSGTVYSLIEKDSGNYFAGGLAFDKEAVYQLRVISQAGIEYLSDTIRILDTPPIDTVVFGVSNDNQSLTVLVDAHDDSGKTRFYSWDFVETYQYHATFYSGLIVKNGAAPTERKPEENIYRCWRTLNSTKISVSSSGSLAEDVIHRYEIISIPKESPKISVRYSILVKQRAVSLEEYDYLVQLRKSTENLGTIFGYQPTSVTGNIHAVKNSNTPVLGYFSGAQVREKRYFIDRSELPEHLKVLQSREGCMADTTCLSSNEPEPLSPCIRTEDLGTNNLILSPVSNAAGFVVGYLWTDARCADCRMKGGTTQVPDFW